ncbi:Gfo/Idh/MocA family protein [Lichenicoccus sp.]|uniref:Gfo/Idh/MocA family protein n=1 Tax=Lichenicoccus sp. TaxID=2781899 RepID=UPI003D12919D
MSRIGVAVIGLGPASEPHLRSLLELEDRVEIRWAVSRSTARTQAAAACHGVPVTNDAQRAITDPGVSAVLLLTPPSAHLELAEQCFGHGKHVLVEKPLETSVTRARRLVCAARVSGCRLGVVLQHRFRPGSERLAELLAACVLGEIAAGWVTVPWWRPQTYYDQPGRGTFARDGGGVLLSQAIHTLDLFRSLVGVSGVTAAHIATTGLHRMEAEDYAVALLRLGNGAPGMLAATTSYYPGSPERIEIIGTRGSAILAGSQLELRCLDGTGEVVEGDGGTGSGAGIMDFPHDAHRALLADFLDAILADRDPRVTGEEALATQELIEQILAQGHRTPSFPDKL